MSESYLIKRGENYSFRRRIPSFVQHLDHRTEIKVSLKTNDKKEAIAKATIYNQHIENFWRTLIKQGKEDKGFYQFNAAIQLAKANGFAYKTASELATGSIEEIVERVSTSLSTKHEAEAALGGVQRPSIKLSDCNIQYWDLTIDRLVDKSDHQIRKWQNPRRASLKNFIAVVGDKPIDEINRTDILKFKDWWRVKIGEGKSPATGNKQLLQIKDILSTVSEHNQINLDCDLLFNKSKFQYKVLSRPPFSVKYVQDKLLPGLFKLNERDRLVVMAMADTGARESELFGLTPADINLESEIPFIWIRPREGYRLKTATSERQIPLVGVALEAFKLSPTGFTHMGNPDVFSTMVNKYLTDQKLRPTERHSIYSLRHTFKDRLRDIEAPEELIDSLMGHKKKGPQYGRGHKLEAKHKWLEKIQFKPH